MISTTLPPSGRGLLKLVDELTKLVVRLVPRDDFLAIDAAWLVSRFFGTVDVPLDAPDAERMAALEGLHVFHVHGVLAVAAVGMATKAAELLTVCHNDAMHEQDLHKDLAVLGGKVVVRVALGLVMGPLEPLAEPVEALEMEWWGFFASTACTGGVDSIFQCYILVGRETGRRWCLVAGEVDVVAW